MHGCNKHIDMRFHFLHEITKNGVGEIIHCPTQEHIADVMTKPLKLDTFLKMHGLMGVCSVQV